MIRFQKNEREREREGLSQKQSVTKKFLIEIFARYDYIE